MSDKSSVKGPEPVKKTDIQELIEIFISFSVYKASSSFIKEKNTLKLNHKEVEHIVKSIGPNTKKEFEGIPFYLNKLGKEIIPSTVIINNISDNKGIFLVLNDNDKNLFINEKNPTHNISIFPELSKIINEDLIKELKNTKSLKLKIDKNSNLFSTFLDENLNELIFNQPFFKNSKSDRIFVQGEELESIKTIDDKIPKLFIFNKERKEITLSYYPKNFKYNKSNVSTKIVAQKSAKDINEIMPWWGWLFLILFLIVVFCIIIMKYFPSVAKIMESIPLF